MITYKKAGVDVDAGDALVQRIKKMSPLIGGFAGLFPLPTKGLKNPQLVGCTDGVGTKLKIAFLADKHDTVGIDLVAMNVNDLLCCGAKPLFFLDYFACGKLDVDVAEQVVRGIVNGCKQSNCVLLGGETAEMPGFYGPGEYDLAGFATGVVDKSKVINGKRVRPGDIVLGVPSSGLHSNGYSLVRKLFTEAELKRRSGEFLEPTKIYVHALWPLIERKTPVLKALSHITGEGFIGNIPRVLPKGVQARITMRSWPVPELFHEIQSRAGIPDEEMFNTLNMGIGMVLVVSPKDVPLVEKQIRPVYPIGVIEEGSKGIRFV
jgi:phosphoribosylformylglycinamidine cyclo-ligase